MYRRSLEWSLDHRGVIVAVSLLVFSSRFVLSRMVGRSFLPNEDMGEFQLVIDTPEGHVAPGHGEDGARADAAAARRAGHRARDADDLRARQPLAHLHPAEAVRRAEGHAGAGRGRRPQASWLAHPGYKPTIVMRTPIGGGETASYPIQVNLMGPDLRQLSGYALSMLKDVQAMPFISDSKAVVNLSNPELRVAVDRQRAADLGVRDRRPGARAPADGQRRGRDFELSREGGALSGDDPRARGPALRHARDRRADGAVHARRAGAGGQRRHARARLRADHHPALQPAVLDGDLRRRQAGAAARPRRCKADRREGARAEPAARLQLQVQRPVEAARRDHQQHGAGARARQHLHLHRARDAVRELRAAAGDHDGAAAVGAVRAASRCG